MNEEFAFGGRVYDSLTYVDEDAWCLGLEG
jgi:hypothetical protein